MAAIEKELADAFGEIIDAEIESALSEAGSEQHEFSPKFKKQMEELIRTGKPNNKAASRRSARRIVLIAIAAVLALALAACAIPQVREFIAGFFVQHKDDHDEYSSPDVTKDYIEEEYGFESLPEGFKLVYETKGNNYLEALYADDSGNVIMFRQSANKINEDSVDTEHGETFIHNIGEKEVLIHYSEVGARATWIENGYYFSLDYGSNVELSLFEELIASVKVK